jgi:hypothetical protein
MDRRAVRMGLIYRLRRSRRGGGSGGCRLAELGHFDGWIGADDRDNHTGAARGPHGRHGIAFAAQESGEQQ